MASVTVGSVFVDEGVLLLTGSPSAIAQGQEVVVSYADPSGRRRRRRHPGCPRQRRRLDFTTGEDGVPAVSNKSRVEDTTDATLSGLSLSAVTLDPVFASRTDTYTADAGISVTGITVTAMTRNATATVEYLDAHDAAIEDADTVLAGHQVALVGGANTIKVKVTAADGMTTRTYTVTVTRAASADASLSDLSLSAGTLDPVFASGTDSYTADVGSGVGAITVTAMTSDGDARVEYLDADDAPIEDDDTVTAGHQVALAVGANIIRVKVTAADAVTTRTYTVTVTRPVSADATLSELRLSAGTLDPVFASGTHTYTADIAASVRVITVTAMTSVATATVEYLDESDAPIEDADTVTAGHQVALAGGVNTIKVKVTATDGMATRTYTITATRPASAEASLSDLRLSTGTLDPVFASGTDTYAATVVNSVAAITVTAMATHYEASVAYLDGSDAEIEDADGSLPGHQVALDPGANTIQVKVTAPDRMATRTYTVTVTRAGAADASLSDLSLSDGTLEPAFASSTTTYRADVGNSVETITVTPATSDSDAAVAYLDGNDAEIEDADPVTGGHQVALAAGANTIKVKVTAEDGIETRTYTVTVTRAVAAATSLSGLRLSDGTLDPAFASSTTDYRADVGNSVETVTVMPTTSDVDATVEYLDASDAAIEDADTVMDGHQVALAVGANTIQVKVTAADGMATQTYTVTVIRAASADASLSGLTLSDGSLDPAFATGTDSYTVDVASNVAVITVAAMTAHSGARVAYLDASDAAIEDVDTVMAGHQAPLGMGDNTIKLKVTAEDAMATRTYTVIVTRTVSTDAGLSDLRLSEGTLNPVFASGTTAYGAEVGNSVETITVSPMTSHTGASVAYLDAGDGEIADVDRTAAGQQVALAVGENTIKVKVTAEDAATTETYTVTVARAAPASEPNRTLTPSPADPVAAVHSTAEYTITFKGLWTNTVTPGGLPGTARFSAMIGAVHNDRVTFLQAGGMASAGVESMAEAGGTATLRNEINGNANALRVLERSGNIGATATVTLDATLDTDHPRITLLTRVAPSPDWFAGVSGVSLLDGSGNWVASRTVDLYAWDAGTEEGTEFAGSNAATVPQGAIASLRGRGRFTNARIATLTFTRETVSVRPEISIAADAPKTTIDIGKASFTLTRTGSAAEALSVAVEVTEEHDFVTDALPAAVDFEAGESEAKLELGGLTGDAASTGELTVTVQEGDGYLVSATAGAAAMEVVALDPVLTFRLAAAAKTVGEGEGSVTATVIAETAAGATAPQTTTGMVVALGTADGTAVAGEDFENVSANVSFAPGDFTLSGSVYRAEKSTTIAILDDKLIEPPADGAHESFTVRLARTADTLTRLAIPDTEDAPGEMVVAIEDDDRPAWEVTVSDATIAEADTGSSTVTVSTGGVTFASARTIKLDFNGSTATLTDDYTVGATTLTLNAGESSVETTIAAVNDTVDDDDETIVVSATLDDGGVDVAIGTQRIISITDNDAATGWPTRR